MSTRTRTTRSPTRSVARRAARGPARRLLEEAVGEEVDEGLLRRIRSYVAGALSWVWFELKAQAIENPIVVAGAAYAFVKACGTTVDTGQTGLRFTLGRVSKILDPGFHFMIPFVQRARIVPTRSRTLELEDQRIVTREQLVFVVQANVVWRIVDVEKALIEIDDLVEGMRQLLAISVQEVLRGVARADLRTGGDLDRQLAEVMEEPLAAWGVSVESAGFQSIAPSKRTVRVTQLERRVDARHEAYRALRELGLESDAGSGLVGTRQMPRRRALRAARRDRAARRKQRLTIQRRRVWSDREAYYTQDEKKARKKAEKEAQRKAWLSGESVSVSEID